MKCILVFILFLWFSRRREGAYDVWKFKKAVINFTHTLVAVRLFPLDEVNTFPGWRPQSGRSRRLLFLAKSHILCFYTRYDCVDWRVKT